MMWQVSTRIRHSDVVIMHISAKSAWWLGSGLWLTCAAFRRPVVLKFIGGDFAKIYDGYSVAKRRWANATYMRCALILVQTKAIKSRFQNRQSRPLVSEYPRHPGIRRGPEKRRAAPKSAEDPQKLEAERRLFYVAFTRARRKVVMLAEDTKAISRFVSEMGIGT